MLEWVKINLTKQTLMVPVRFISIGLPLITFSLNIFCRLIRTVVLNLSWFVAPLPRFSVPVAPCPVCLCYSMFESILNHSPPVKASARGPRLRNAELGE